MNIQHDTCPHISVVIPTYQAPEHIQRELDSLAAVSYPSWDVLVVDQSTDDCTQQIVDRMKQVIPHLRYRRLRAKGTCRARNLGFTETEGAIIAFLDHDCTVPPDWLWQVANVAARFPHAANIFGDVKPPEGLAQFSEHGWTPAIETPHEFEAKAMGDARNRLILPQLTSMGACMIVRRSAARQIGFFDVHLGPGGRFFSCEDSDYTYRTLMAGFSVVRTPHIWVEHYGIRDYSGGAASRHLHTYRYATGAWHMKALRLGDPYAMAWLLRELVLYLSYIRVLNLVRGQRPNGLSHIVMYVRGLIESFTLRVDRSAKLYAARSITFQNARRKAKARPAVSR